MPNIIGGLIAIALGIAAMLMWWWRVIDIIQGLLPLALIGGGLVATFAGMSMVEDEAKKGLKKPVPAKSAPVKVGSGK